MKTTTTLKNNQRHTSGPQPTNVAQLFLAFQSPRNRRNAMGVSLTQIIRHGLL